MARAALDLGMTMLVDLCADVDVSYVSSDPLSLIRILQASLSTGTISSCCLFAGEFVT